MTRRKQGQRVLWEGMIDEDVRALWEPWMMQADRLLEDDELIDRVYAAQGERHEHSATKGRAQTPAEMVLRLLLLKHVRNWSFATLEREVRMNLAGCQDAGAHRAGARWRGDRGTASALGGDRAGRKRDSRAQAARRYDGVWKPTFITRPIRACWEMGRGC